ncbi:hypothetical protein V0R50_16545 [Pseudomonas sp. 148P]|uniref:Uncharacterized protein n=1 Tax=Pseudomonas ulcerans TaxID=3115852 RepID=A0ABU7HTG8_9PSED|nr:MULTISPECIES: hypothetical protein [unclassified Pseudomonas]MEE1923285.1 hypothetical protein [Pseudomonas sp. 147P]MEE1934840.1 hypothetical protein [Pseudomonas sp. 148P]
MAVAKVAIEVNSTGFEARATVFDKTAGLRGNSDEKPRQTTYGGPGRAGKRETHEQDKSKQEAKEQPGLHGPGR